jgi:hypothetical protein
LEEEGRMNLGREIQRPLGVVLVERGFVSHEDVDSALAEQIKTNERLGEILLKRSLLARPMLAKALAAQRGRLLEEEGGFGSGLLARIEYLHLRRRGLLAYEGSPEVEGSDEGDDCQVIPLSFPTEAEPDEYELLHRRQEELDRRERELLKLAAQLVRKERKLKREAAKAAPPTAAS